MSVNEHKNKDLEKLEWIQMEETYALSESTWHKLVRKTKENPFVPLGTFATVAALSGGLWSFFHGRPHMSQNMMRARVTAQAFTLIAVIIGFTLSTNKKQKL